jgi:hypothetical protein
MNAVQIKDSTFSNIITKENIQARRIPWTVGVMDNSGIHYEVIMSNKNCHEMTPSELLTLVSSTYNDVFNIYACEADNVNLSCSPDFFANI